MKAHQLWIYELEQKYGKPLYQIFVDRKKTALAEQLTIERYAAELGVDRSRLAKKLRKLAIRWPRSHKPREPYSRMPTDKQPLDLSDPEHEWIAEAVNFRRKRLAQLKRA